jgi:predicted ferric reductase
VATRRAVGWALVLVLAGNALALTWLWYHGGNVTGVKTTGDLLTSVGRITGPQSAYLALVQVVLLARIPPLERAFGLDRLSRWHRWNGFACVDLVVAHVVFTIWGYALMDKLPLGKEISQMIGGGIYPGMITATVGTGLIVAVGASSVVIARRKLSYEWWYAVHLAAYAGIALAWFHEIPTGNELVLDQTAADYWRALYAATLALIVGYRIVVPLVNAVRFRLRVADVVHEAPGIVSLRIGGRDLDRFRAKPGQFFLWRFLDRGRWHVAHPFSLSAAPSGDAFRITVKALGDHSARLAEIAPGTPVLAEGPFGVFGVEAAAVAKVLLVAGGIGVTPIRALLEAMHGDVVVIYRALDDADVVFRDELDALAPIVHYVVGDHRGEGERLLSPQHLVELVPDLTEREVFLCGPPAMTDAIEQRLAQAGVSRRAIHVERFALV